MKRRSLLKETMVLARTGDIKGFESFYILTVQDTFGKASALMKDVEKAEELLMDIYLSLYRQAHTLPLEEEDLNDRIEEEIYHQAEKFLGSDMGKIDGEAGYETLSEERAVALWLKLEELAGFNREEPEEEKNTWISYAYALLKVSITIGLLIVTVALFYKGWQRFIEGDPHAGEEALSTQLETLSQTEAETEEEIQLKEPGWDQSPDRRLFYVTKEGVLADGPIAIGKQILTFSRNGELTMIGPNREAEGNRGLSFDEAVRYEVKNGDIYTKDPGTGEESCVVRNGHVARADIRCGKLWYICEYQVPNTSQVKTTIYRAEPDGASSEEIYTTSAHLPADGFQMTSEWMYFLSNGTLFRRYLEDEHIEYMAQDVEFYFAWEDTAYIMKDRTLECVSEGEVYSGTEAGFQIERTDTGFALLNMFGEEALESGTGEVQAGDRLYSLEDSVITSVRPAARKINDVEYYIEKEGPEQRIYVRDSAGSAMMAVQEGLSVDAICMVEDWLYYSARIERYGDECESQIYRVNLKTMELEQVGTSFRGFMRNLYYFDNIQAILGEYIPSVADPEQIHGSIANVSVETIDILNDTPARPDYDGSDMLELVMADRDQVYCLYHRCSYDGESGNFLWESTDALEFELSGFGAGG